MENKENFPIQKNNLPHASNSYMYTVKLVYCSNVYTFASRNHITLPERRSPKTQYLCISQCEEDDYEGIFYDVDPSLTKNNKRISNNEIINEIINEKTKKQYGITDCLLADPFSIHTSSEVKTCQSMIF